MDERILTCVYCGHEYPAGTPPHGNELLTEHITKCEKHPMKTIIEEHRLLRSALIGLVGADDTAELEQMEVVIRMAPVPEQDKANTINAIHAVMNTMSR